jgi:leucyl aminopeptidase
MFKDQILKKGMHKAPEELEIDILLYAAENIETEETKEMLWQMPVSDVFHEELKSKVADLSNTGVRLSGSSIAAAFFVEFIEEVTLWS